MGKQSNLKLNDGARIAVIGGGPAGSFFSYFLLRVAERVGRRIQVDIYEPRNFNQPGPAGCNMCAGVVSETLVQYLATEGINLPSTVVERGIDSYMLHMDVGSVHIESALHEKRIATLHRGLGPRDLRDAGQQSRGARYPPARGRGRSNRGTMAPQISGRYIRIVRSGSRCRWREYCRLEIVPRIGP